MKAPLFDNQLALGAKMINFFKWGMPLQYTSILEEAKDDELLNKWSVSS